VPVHFSVALFINRPTKVPVEVPAELAVMLMLPLTDCTTAPEVNSIAVFVVTVRVLPLAKEVEPLNLTMSASPVPV